MPDAGHTSLLRQLPALVSRHRRSLSGLLLLSVLVLCGLWGVRWLSDPYRFPLDVVEVKGEFRFLQKETLQAAVMPLAAGGFFTVDVDGIRAAVEVLPWVNKAKVRRVWPATLQVRITEQRPVAQWNEDGFLNQAGEAFFPRSGAAPVGLPRLAGPDGQEFKVLQEYRRVRRTLQPLGVEVTRLAMDSRRAWSLQLDNGVQLKLGRTQHRQRLQRFVRAWPEVFAGRVANLESVDMRYSNGFSVFWQRPVVNDVVAKRDI